MKGERWNSSHFSLIMKLDKGGREMKCVDINFWDHAEYSELMLHQYTLNDA